MILKLRQRMAQDESGFTLVELLVVMLILGLLAAIAIPAFFNQRDKAYDADAKASARTAETAAETLATQNGANGYSGANGVTVANLQGVEETLNGANLAVSGVTDDTYTVTVTADSTDHTFSITRNTDGTTDLGCQPDTGAGGCPVGGDWSGE